MNRREFLHQGSGTLAGCLASASIARASLIGTAARLRAGAPGAFTLSGHAFLRPLPITMWDFSWLERRWPGAGYEDWDQVLDELKVRGYEAVRIDPYPHLLALDAQRRWEIRPEWSTQDWGSQALNWVQIQPALNQFIEKCAVRDIWVALSTWFQEDTAERFRWIKQPEDLGKAWKATLDSINAAGLLGNILYVDLCNEWPIEPWTPFLTQAQRDDPREMHRWTTGAIGYLRRYYPRLSYTFSGFMVENPTSRDAEGFDLLELHIWMAQSSFNDEAGYHFERFESKGYENLVKNAERVYRARP
jgi:Sugar-binding cellulase-like